MRINLNKQPNDGRDVWITSDLHGNHANILNFQSNRGSKWASVEEMNDALVAEWNSKVKEDDIVIQLGDIAFGSQTKVNSFVKRLNGWEFAINIKGNHDRSGWTNNLYDYVELKLSKDLQEYWQLTGNSANMIILMHFPIVDWNYCSTGSFMLHGHTHGRYKGQGRTMDVGYDSLGSIVKLESVLKMLNDEPIINRFGMEDM